MLCSWCDEQYLSLSASSQNSQLLSPTVPCRNLHRRYIPLLVESRDLPSWLLCWVHSKEIYMYMYIDMQTFACKPSCMHKITHVQVPVHHARTCTCTCTSVYMYMYVHDVQVPVFTCGFTRTVLYTCIYNVHCTCKVYLR